MPDIMVITKTNLRNQIFKDSRSSGHLPNIKCDHGQRVIIYTFGIAEAQRGLKTTPRISMNICVVSSYKGDVDDFMSMMEEFMKK